jgi:hypothetical protein
MAFVISSQWSEVALPVLITVNFSTIFCGAGSAASRVRYLMVIRTALSTSTYTSVRHTSTSVK